jgi:hypothetical protein
MKNFMKSFMKYFTKYFTIFENEIVHVHENFHHFME